jgi:3-methyladenine DNA glycosylase Mpg
MLNICVEPAGIPGCVLLRGTTQCAGPGLLTRHFGLDGRHYGADLMASPLAIYDADPLPEDSVLITPRIGITQAADLPLRFVKRGFEKRKRQPR